MRRVIYVAHPIGALTPSGVKSNVDRGMRWLGWHRRSFPETTFIAPYLAAIMSGEDDADPAQREAGLVDACAVVERCDGISLCGGRVSSGMARERDHGVDRHAWPRLSTFTPWDLTKLGPEPPSSPWTGLPFVERFGTDGSWR